MQYLEYKGFSENKATQDCGLAQALIYRARIGKSDLGSKAIDKILSKYQDLNRSWLLIGEGPMLIDSNPIIQISGGDSFNNIHNSSIDNRHYYSDSPDVLRAEIDKMDRILQGKDALISEKDKQISEKDKQISELISLLHK